MRLQVLENILSGAGFSREAMTLRHFCKLGQKEFSYKYPPKNVALSKENIDEAIEEFGDTPIQEEEYLEQTLLPPKDSDNIEEFLIDEMSWFGDPATRALDIDSKKIKEILRRKGIFLPDIDLENLFLGAGVYGTVVECMYKGLRAVVKIYKIGTDDAVWAQIQKIKKRLPEKLQKHFPEIYDIGRIDGTDYKYIVSERLYPLYKEIKNSISSPTEFTPEALQDYADNIVSVIVRCLERRFFHIHDMTELRGFVESRLAYFPEKKLRYMFYETEFSNALEYILNQMLKTGTLEFFGHKREFKSSNFLVKEMLEVLKSMQIRGVPNRGGILGKAKTLSSMKHTSPALQSLLDALNALSDYNITFGDMHYGNIMMGADGTLKISDVGGFDIDYLPEELNDKNTETYNG